MASWLLGGRFAGTNASGALGDLFFDELLEFLVALAQALFVVADLLFEADLRHQHLLERRKVFARFRLELLLKDLHFFVFAKHELHVVDRGIEGGHVGTLIRGSLPHDRLVYLEFSTLDQLTVLFWLQIGLFVADRNFLLLDCLRWLVIKFELWFGRSS